MNTLALAQIRPLLTAKSFWIRANRILAWSLIASPPLQWALGMRLGTGLLIDLGILLVHAGLSFALFGKPETKTRAFRAGMHLFGFRPAGLSARNQFLLTGYRIGAAMLAIALLIARVPLVWLLLLYPLLRLPVSVFQHLFRAMVYALRRWGVRDNPEGSAALIIVLYVVLSMINLFR
jgi:hypothetical protein